MAVALYTTHGDSATLVKRFVLNQDGRNPDGLLPTTPAFAPVPTAGFHVQVFQGPWRCAAEPNFLNRVSLDFGVAHTDQHYHVPLLVSPWSYSTYRGS